MQHAKAPLLSTLQRRQHNAKQRSSDESERVARNQAQEDALQAAEPAGAIGTGAHHAKDGKPPLLKLDDGRFGVVGFGGVIRVTDEVKVYVRTLDVWYFYK